MRLRTLRRMPKFDASTCASVHVVPQRSLLAPYVRVESDVPQSVVDALSFPEAAPALSRKTS